MAVTRLNHAVLYVSDVDRSVAFYNEIFGFEPISEMAQIRNAAFLRAPGSTNDHDLGLFQVDTAASAQAAPGGGRSVGLYHLAWEVDTLDDLERIAARLSTAGALGGASDHGTTKSLYGRDPDGLEFEVVWIIPADLIDDEARRGRTSIRPLDLAREKRKYGATTRGGIGISQPV